MASKKIVILAVVATFIMTAGSIALAKVEAGKAGKADRAGAGPCMMMEQGGKALGLTDDQKTKLKSICESYRPQIQALRKDTTLTPDQKKAKVKEIMTKMHAEISAVLTPDQKKKFDQMQTRMQNRHKGIQAALAQLGLTDDQKAKVKAIFQSHKGEMKAISEDASLTKEQKMDKFKALQQKIKDEVKVVLTSEQQKKLDDILQKARNHKGSHSAHGGQQK